MSLRVTGMSLLKGQEKEKGTLPWESVSPLIEERDNVPLLNSREVYGESYAGPPLDF